MLKKTIMAYSSNCVRLLDAIILFQNIFKFCTFLLKFSNILPFLNISLTLFWQIAPMPSFSRIDSDHSKSCWTFGPHVENWFCKDNDYKLCYITSSGTHKRKKLKSKFKTENYQFCLILAMLKSSRDHYFSKKVS